MSLLSALRRVWMIYDSARKEKLKEVKVMRAYQCERCGKLFNRVYIHHVNPVKTKGTERIICESLFVDKSLLQALCQECHKAIHISLNRNRD
jgi:predicted HNH restriction endonuclease